MVIPPLISSTEENGDVEADIVIAVSNKNALIKHTIY